MGATLGKVDKTTQSACFNQQINSLTTYLDIDALADYIVLALKFPSFQKLAWSKAGTGTLPIISKKLLSYSATFSDGNFNHGDTNHIFSGLGEDLKIFGQASKSAQPSKRSFDNPAFGNHLESVRRFSGDIDAVALTGFRRIQR